MKVSVSGFRVADEVELLDVPHGVLDRVLERGAPLHAHHDRDRAAADPGPGEGEEEPSLTGSRYCNPLILIIPSFWLRLSPKKINVNQRLIARCRDQWSSLHRPPAHLVSLEQNSEPSDYSFSQFYVSPMYDCAACRGQY